MSSFRTASEYHKDKMKIRMTKLTYFVSKAIFWNNLRRGCSPAALGSMTNLKIRETEYSGGSSTEHLNSESIQNPNILKIGNGMIQFWNSTRTGHSKTEPVLRVLTYSQRGSISREDLISLLKMGKLTV